MLLPAKRASEPSPKLIIVATHTHGNNGGLEIAMLHLVADPHPLDDYNYKGMCSVLKMTWPDLDCASVM